MSIGAATPRSFLGAGATSSATRPLGSPKRSVLRSPVTCSSRRAAWRGRRSTPAGLSWARVTRTCCARLTCWWRCSARGASATRLRTSSSPPCATARGSSAIHTPRPASLCTPWRSCCSPAGTCQRQSAGRARRWTVAGEASAPGTPTPSPAWARSCTRSRPRASPLPQWTLAASSWARGGSCSGRGTRTRCWASAASRVSCLTAGASTRPRSSAAGRWRGSARLWDPATRTRW
mmetsp:Transcript_40640/g.116391  ORF Transcript_40640/g.116391 Transcript_40640/m.116391 type:complete len:234 (-) Transcript_40640:65-766(-)